MADPARPIIDLPPGSKPLICSGCGGDWFKVYSRLHANRGVVVAIECQGCHGGCEVLGGVMVAPGERSQ